MDVSPQRPGDNVFVNISPGKSFQYRVDIPKDHPQGLHWYHSHLHEFVDPQILSGLSGMLIVDGGIENHYPEFADLRQRVMVLKDINLPGGTAPTRTVNGLSNPPIHSRPGELQIWAIGNLGADSFFDLRLEGHRFWVLERDGNFLRKPVLQDTLFLPPGARTLVVVEAGAPGRYYFQTKDVDTGPTGLPSPRARLGTFVVEGPPVLGGKLADRLERVGREHQVDRADRRGAAHDADRQAADVHLLGRARLFRVLHQPQDLRSQPDRHQGRSRPRRGMDDPQRGRRAARLPPAPDLVPGEGGQRRAAGLSWPARRHQRPLADRRHAGRGQAASSRSSIR